MLSIHGDNFDHFDHNWHYNCNDCNQTNNPTTTAHNARQRLRSRFGGYINEADICRLTLMRSYDVYGLQKGAPLKRVVPICTAANRKGNIGLSGSDIHSDFYTSSPLSWTQFMVVLGSEPLARIAIAAKNSANRPKLVWWQL
jgi:hypothetical protein